MTLPAFPVSEGYAPRPRIAGPLLIRGDWHIKTYGIAYARPPRLPGTETSVVAAVDHTLPKVDTDAGRPGAGWCILHVGRDMDYLVVGWWDRENEAPVRIWIREGPEPWRPAAEESFCVWDMEVMSHERDAWVRHVLTDRAGDLAAYLSDRAPDVG